MNHLATNPAGRQEFQAVYRMLESTASGPVVSEPRVINGVVASSADEVSAMLKANQFVVLHVTPVRALPNPLCAQDDDEAASVLGVSRTTLWKLCNLPRRDARRINRTSYGKIPLKELERHLAAEVEQAA